jgi:hypothetical protein
MFRLRVGGDVGQHGDGILGRDGIEPGFQFLGNGLDLFDLDQVFLDVFWLRLRRLLGLLGGDLSAQAENKAENNKNG